jgi:hypothetical protein
MTAIHLIISDAGCYESGNELPEDLRLALVVDSALAEQSFADACQYCRRHVESQLVIIDSSEHLVQSSGYYWSVLWLELPNFEASSCSAAMENLRTYLEEPRQLTALIRRIESSGLSDRDAVARLVDGLT